MDLDVLLVDYVLYTSAVRRLGWLVVRFHGVLNGWDGVVGLIRGVLSSWVEMNFDGDVERKNLRWRYDLVVQGHSVLNG